MTRTIADWKALMPANEEELVRCQPPVQKAMGDKEDDEATDDEEEEDDDFEDEEDEDEDEEEEAEQEASVRETCALSFFPAPV